MARFKKQRTRNRRNRRNIRTRNKRNKRNRRNRRTRQQRNIKNRLFSKKNSLRYRKKYIGGMDEKSTSAVNISYARVLLDKLSRICEIEYKKQFMDYKWNKDIYTNLVTKKATENEWNGNTADQYLAIANHIKSDLMDFYKTRESTGLFSKGEYASANKMQVKTAKEIVNGLFDIIFETLTKSTPETSSKARNSFPLTGELNKEKDPNGANRAFITNCLEKINDDKDWII